MTHFGIICPPYPGHLNPLSALGRELQSRGHKITFLQIPDLASKVESEGLNFLSVFLQDKHNSSTSRYPSLFYALELPKYLVGKVAKSGSILLARSQLSTNFAGD